MGKPSAPDPTATASAQGASNKETAIANANLNRINQYSPLGESTYQITGYNSDGTPQYSQTTSLSAPVQGILNSQLANQQVQQNISTNLLDSVSSRYSKPINVSKVNPLNTGMTPAQLAAMNGKYATTAGPAATSSASTAQGTGAALGNYVTTGGNGGGDIQRRLDIGSVPGLIKGAQDAAYANQMAYLQPQFTNDQNDLNSKLAAQGITQGSAAWDRAQSELSRNQTFQQQQAQNAAFEQGLQGGQTAFGMIQGQGQFTNAAQQQGYDQALANAGLANHAADATTQNNQFNAGQAQANNQFNAAQATQNSQFNAGQANTQSQFNADLNNAAVSSQFGNTMTNANLNNAANAQGMQNAFAVYNQPLNTYNQLQSGAQAAMPTFTSTPSANMAPTDVGGIINNAYANRVGASNGTMQGLGQAAALAAMYMMA